MGAAPYPDTISAISAVSFSTNFGADVSRLMRFISCKALTLLHVNIIYSSIESCSSIRGASLASEASMTETITSPQLTVSMINNGWEGSIGQPCGTFGASYQCWVAIGPARELFNQISDGIKGILEDHNDDLEEVQSVSSPIGWTMYMIGYRFVSSAFARPTLLLECIDSGVRKKARKIIRESRLWRDTVAQYPRIKLADCSRGPQLVGDDLAESSSTHQDGNTVYVGYGIDNLCGAPILWDSGRDALSSRKATLGGIILVDGVPRGLSVAHAFNEAQEISHAEMDPDDLTYDDDLSIDDDSDLEFWAAGSKISNGKLYQTPS